jgi:hypothetical protein
MMELQLTITVTPKQIEVVNFMLSQAVKYICNNQPNPHELLPADAIAAADFRTQLLDKFLDKAIPQEPTENAEHPEAQKAG